MSRTTTLWLSGSALGSRRFQTGLQIDDWVSIPIPCCSNFFSSLDPWSLSTTEVKNEWKVHLRSPVRRACRQLYLLQLCRPHGQASCRVRTPFVISSLFLCLCIPVCLARDLSPIQGVRPNAYDSYLETPIKIGYGLHWSAPSLNKMEPREHTTYGSNTSRHWRRWIGLLVVIEIKRRACALLQTYTFTYIAVFFVSIHWRIDDWDLSSELYLETKLESFC